MTRREQPADPLGRLRQLLDAGAITRDDYQHLVSAVNTPMPGRSQLPPSGSRFIQNAGSIAAGVFAGTMAADLLSSALSDPTPVTYEYTSVSETTFTDDGFVTTTNETFTSDEGSDPLSDSANTEHTYAEAPGDASGYGVGGGYEDIGDLEV